METSSWYAIKQRVAWHEQGVPVSDVCRYYGIIPPHRIRQRDGLTSGSRQREMRCFVSGAQSHLLPPTGLNIVSVLSTYQASVGRVNQSAARAIRLYCDGAVMPPDSTRFIAVSMDKSVS